MSTFVTTRSGGNLYENTIVPMNFDPQDRSREPAYSLPLIAKAIGAKPRAATDFRTNSKNKTTNVLPWHDYRDELYLPRNFVEEFLRTKGLVEKFKWDDLWKYQFGFADKVTPDTIQEQPIFDKMRAYNMTTWSNEMGFKVQKRSDWWESQIVQDIIREKGLQLFDRNNSFERMPKVLFQSFVEYCQRLPEKDKPYAQIVDVNWDTYENGYVKFIIKEGSKIIQQTCIWCGESKLAEDYRIENCTLRSECNICRTSSSKERRNDAIAHDVHKTCKTCALTQHVQHFDGNHAECNKCRTKASSQKNKDKFDVASAIEQGRFKDCVDCGLSFDQDMFTYALDKGAYKGRCKICYNKRNIDAEASAKRHDKGKEAYGEEYLNENAHQKKKFLDSNPEKQTEYSVKDSYAALNAIRSRAKRESIPFTEADAAQMEQMLTKPCYLCGSPGNPFNGLDRKDRKSPYSAETTEPCCKVCNLMRFDWDVTMFLDIMSKIAKYHLQETQVEEPDFTGAILGFKNTRKDTGTDEVNVLSYRKAAYQFQHIADATTCYLCGDPYDEEYEDHTAPQPLKRPYAKSVDRVDTSKNDGDKCGYVEDNVLPCHRICNFMKGDRPLKAVLAHARKISQFRRASSESIDDDASILSSSNLGDDVSAAQQSTSSSSHSKSAQELIREEGKRYKRSKLDERRLTGESKRDKPRPGITGTHPRYYLWRNGTIVKSFPSKKDILDFLDITPNPLDKYVKQGQTSDQWCVQRKEQKHSEFQQFDTSDLNGVSISKDLKAQYSKQGKRDLMVEEVDSSGNVVTYKSVVEAAKSTGVPQQNMEYFVNGGGSHPNGKVYRYV